MRGVMASFRMRATLVMLESTAAHAGRAMACPFGSSSEFEAALIRARRKAGAYGRKRQLRVLAIAAIGLLLTALLCSNIRP
jgi:DNA invertase Pin-like site-specific DNA recombinase